MRTHLITLLASLFSLTFSYAQSPSLGTLPLYSEITEADIIAHLGTPTEIASGGSQEDQMGEEVAVKAYSYYSPEHTLLYRVFLKDVKKQIYRAVIKARDLKFALNGKVMVGDPLSKLMTLGVQIDRNSYFDKYNYCMIYLPVYKKEGRDYYYYIRVNYDDNDVITAFILEEDTGV